MSVQKDTTDDRDSMVKRSISKEESLESQPRGLDSKILAEDTSQDLADAEPPVYRLTDYILRRENLKAWDGNAIATRRSVYDDPVLAEHYRPKPDYENLHRFDPSARWTYAEESALVRRIDWKIMLWAAISFSALNLDRGNLTQANTDNILPDLGMTTDDYNLGNTLFRLAFLCAELPSQLVSKRLGPDRWIPIQMILWSIVTLAQFWLSGRSSFLACRALLGFIQGGFIPDLILYLSCSKFFATAYWTLTTVFLSDFYTKSELPVRLSLFWVSSNFCTIIASFLAFGILRLRGYRGLAGWRWLFLIEGLITLTVGILTFFRMPPSPTQTKTWYRPKGWFSEREEIIMVNRILRDDPTKGDMHNREGLTIKRLWTAVCDYDMWPMYIIGLMFGIPTTTAAFYLTLSLRNLGFNTFQTNLLTIPSNVAGMFTMFGITVISETFNERSMISMAQDLWTLPFLIALYVLPAKPNPWIFFGVSTGLLSYPYTHPIQVGWCSRNSGAVASRTVNASIYNMFVQASAVIAAQVYRKDDAPRYHRGNRALLIITIVNICFIYPGTKLYYIYRNKQRDLVWNAMTPEGQSNYLSTTKDLGNRRLDFRFAH